MAKEFKDYDRAFTKAQIMNKRRQYLFGDHSEIKSWEHAVEIAVWSNDFIRQAVYFVYDAEEWQLFRVSLKGLSTQEKLLMLENRWNVWVKDNTTTTEHRDVEKCRIDNYLGALVRGGQLAVRTYEVLK